jgi:PAS domain S-box-containing protein
LSIDPELGEALLDAVSNGVIVWELEAGGDAESLRLVYANRGASRLLGFDLCARVGDGFFSVFPEGDRERARAYAEVASTRVARDFGVVKSETTGGHALSIRATPVLERAIAVVFEDLDALRVAKGEAEQVTRFLDSIIEQMPAMVFMKDAERLCFERFNRAGEDLLGLPREQLIGKSDYDFFPPEQADFFVKKDREVLSSGTLDIPEEPIQTQRGQRWLHTRKIPLLDEHGHARHLLGVSIDITEKKRAEDALRAAYGELEQRVLERTAQLERQIEERVRAEQALASTEEQLRQAQKMEAVGRLAGGVAHDFNNILSAILSYSSLALSELAPTDSLHGDLIEIMRAAERAGQLTRQLLAFSRRQMLEPRIVDLNQVLAGLHQMLRRLIGEDIELRNALAPDLYRVRVDVGQIEQVVLNLVVNARDAMPRGGRLTIETANVLLDEQYAREHVEISPGPHVMLAVSDTGMGMDRDTQARVFEPFFTTKEQGKGTGLGLSTVFGIVKQSGGSIFVYSEPDKGAAFKIFLPSAGKGRSTSEPRMPAVIDKHGGETVLVVEDDDQVRAVVLSILRRAGYVLLEANGAAQALSVVEQSPREIQLLLTDVVMPGLSGPELARELKSRRPKLRVLCMSGYTDDAVLQHGILDAEMAFIQKPLTPDSLLRRVREVLETSEPARR